MRVRVSFLLAAAISLAAPAVASADVPHTVSPGESLWSIAAADGLTVDQLAAANGLSSASELMAGSTVDIPPQAGGVPAPSPAASEAAAPESAASESAGGESAGEGGVSEGGGGASAGAGSSGGSYLVRPGDSLWAIAQRSGMSVAQLAAENGLNPNGILRSGVVLSVGGGGGGGSAEAAPSSGGAASGESAAAASGQAAGSEAGSQSASSQPVGSAAEGSSGGPPYPTAESVAPSDVGQIAAANGVSPSLAEAIAYQESGFNNGLTSSADARGVMQILPGTWNWINQNLAGSTPLDPASAGSNIRAGVLLLHSLLNETGGDPALAAAGYYQGLPSVLAHGEDPSTQQYVNDVMALRQRFGGG
ncbi:MAG: LysM peptidoglycan-binding domain-containing protein [Solirubrobacterales bacterium]|nr:LysM peptidoglycan-binding domain-containing protein [Solirubrobacterales bacterium]